MKLLGPKVHVRGGSRFTGQSLPPPPLLKNNLACVRLTVRLKLESQSRVMKRQSSGCSACSAPKRQCQGVRFLPQKIYDLGQCRGYKNLTTKIVHSTLV